MNVNKLTKQYDEILADLNQTKNQLRLAHIKTTAFSLGFIGGALGTLFILNKVRPTDNHHDKH